MSSVDALMRELEQTLASGSESGRSNILKQITDLFVSSASGLPEDQIGIFDAVILQVSRDIEREARIELAEKLAPVANAPKGVIQQLAMDEIAVAKPVLSTSKRLSNDDLVAIGTAKGEQHMLAMTSRDDLGEKIAHHLVVKGGRVVSRALAANTTAKLSRNTIDVLVMRAFIDPDLQTALAVRQDLPPELATQIIHLAKITAQKRLQADLEPGLAREIDSAVEAGAKNVAATTRFSVGVATLDPEQEALQAKADNGTLTEADVHEFARSGNANMAISAFAALAGFGVTTAYQTIHHPKEVESILLVSRALDWSWETTRALIELRSTGKSELQIQRAKRSFEALSRDTGLQVLAFLRQN